MGREAAKHPHGAEKNSVCIHLCTCNTSIQQRITATMSTSDSYIIQDAVPDSNDQDEVDSLPSSAVSSDFDSEEASDAQKEWEASLQQLELLLTMVVVPAFGKYLGRKCAYWSWAKYMRWMYPVEIRYTNKTAFRATGVVEAAASL